MGFILVYVTYPSMDEANKTINHLLQKKLIACSNSFPMKASSCWTGKIAECDEIVSILKTREENWEKVKSEINRLHSYKIPCIMKIDVESNEDYEGWVNKETADN